MFQSNGQRHKLGDVRKLGRCTWHLGLGDTDAFSTMRGSTGFKLGFHVAHDFLVSSLLGFLVANDFSPSGLSIIDSAHLGTQHLERPVPVGRVVLIPGIFMAALR